MTKLQNYFKDFLPLKYHDFQVARDGMTANQSVVAELLRVCCEEDDVKAMRMAFERILGKPEKVLIIKRMNMRVTYPEAAQQELAPPAAVVEEAPVVPAFTEDKVVIPETDAPGVLLRRMLDEMGSKPAHYAYDVLEEKSTHSVAHVFVANVYAVAMRGGNLSAIDLLFSYLDGAIADVVRISSNDTIWVENYAQTAPHDAIRDEHGVYYVERELVT